MVFNASLLYNGLIEPLLPVKKTENSPIDMMKTNGLKKIISQLSDKSIWPKPPSSMRRFEELAMKEFLLASRMSCLTSERALIGKDLRCGKNIKKTDLKKLHKKTEGIISDFKDLWLSRNKSSRLKDNLKLFRRSKNELTKLINKK